MSQRRRIPVMCFAPGGIPSLEPRQECLGVRARRPTVDQTAPKLSEDVLSAARESRITHLGVLVHHAKVIRERPSQVTEGSGEDPIGPRMKPEDRADEKAESTVVQKRIVPRRERLGRPPAQRLSNELVVEFITVPVHQFAKLRFNLFGTFGRIGVRREQGVDVHPGAFSPGRFEGSAGAPTHDR